MDFHPADSHKQPYWVKNNNSKTGPLPSMKNHIAANAVTLSNGQTHQNAICAYKLRSICLAALLEITELQTPDGRSIALSEKDRLCETQLGHLTGSSSTRLYKSVRLETTCPIAKTHGVYLDTGGMRAFPPSRHHTTTATTTELEVTQVTTSRSAMQARERSTSRLRRMPRT